MSSILAKNYPSNPNCDIWLQSYLKEKGGLESLNVFDLIKRNSHFTPQHSGHMGKALPSLSVLVVKPDKDVKPNHAPIVVLRTYEDRYYTSLLYGHKMVTSLF